MKVDCASRQRLRLELPVQADDGSRHEIDTRMEVASDTFPTGTDLCQQNGHQTLSADLAGTFADPLLRVSNTSAEPVRVAIDAIGAAGSRQDVDISTRPALPIVLRPGQAQSLHVVVRIRSCTIAPADTTNGSGYLQLSAEPARSGVTRPPQVSSGVDLTAVIGAAVARRCR
jgi:hypothetical protein